MFNNYKIIPVVVINELEDTIPMLTGLLQGGINIAEITFRTDCAKDAIKLAKKAFPNMIIGAGTVVNLQQAKDAIDAGAQFIVSPGVDLETCQYLNSISISYLPGAVTPTEIMTCLSYGIDTVKFFPASCYGGIATLKSLAGPFKNVKFVPTGGIDETNILSYLSLKNVVAIGGSFMMKGDIKENSKRVLNLINKGE